MKLNLKENEQWLSEKKARRKKILVRILLAIFLILAGCTIYLTIHGYRITNGLFYPIPRMQPEKTGEPATTLPSGYVSVLHAPSLPYSFTIQDNVDLETRDGCVYTKEHYYISIYEAAAEKSTSEVLRNTILPPLCKDIQESTLFLTEEGYLNNRLIKVSTETFLVKDAKLHTLTYRIITGADNDLFLTGSSLSSSFKEIEQELQKVFYSIREETNTEATQKLGESIHDVQAQENVLWQKSDTENIAMDNEDFTEEQEIFQEHAAKYVREINENIIYVESQEHILSVKEPLEDAYFVFEYSNANIPLNYIYLYEPDGETFHFPDIESDGNYIFHIQNPQTGDWKYRFSADSYIGIFYAYAEEKDTYDTYHERD